MRFRARQRLRVNKDFAILRRTGKRHPFPGFLGQATMRESEGEGRRLGLRVSRKVGNAVVRNRIKRILRELFRLHQNELPATCDLVIVAHPTLLSMEHKLIEDHFRKLCEQIQALAVT